MGPIRAWLFYAGHVDAAKALAGVDYHDTQDAWGRLGVEAEKPGLTKDREAELMAATLVGLPPSPGSILPTLAEASAVKKPNSDIIEIAPE